MSRLSVSAISATQATSDPQSTSHESGISGQFFQIESGIDRINVISGSSHTALMSNFARTPFTLEGRSFESVEGFIQLIKYTEKDPVRENIAQLAGLAARRAGHDANRRNFRLLAAEEPVFVYWGSEQIPYRSDRHFQLIESALRAKFEQNQAAANQMLATGSATLYHDTGRPENMHTSLPGDVFCRLLSKIRDELNTKANS